MKNNLCCDTLITKNGALNTFFLSLNTFIKIYDTIDDWFW